MSKAPAEIQAKADRACEIQGQATGCCHPTRQQMREWGRELRTLLEPKTTHCVASAALRRIEEVHPELAVSLYE